MSEEECRLKTTTAVALLFLVSVALAVLFWFVLGPRVEDRIPERAKLVRAAGAHIPWWAGENKGS